jgi:hypothetical protein
MVAILKGDTSGKVKLFNEFIERIIAGGELAENEVSIFETLKAELVTEGAD